jgi:hypothetical protein
MVLCVQGRWMCYATFLVGARLVVHAWRSPRVSCCGVCGGSVSCRPPATWFLGVVEGFRHEIFTRASVCRSSEVDAPHLHARPVVRVEVQWMHPCRGRPGRLPDRRGVLDTLAKCWREKPSATGVMVQAPRMFQKPRGVRTTV